MSSFVSSLISDTVLSICSSVLMVLYKFLPVIYLVYSIHINLLLTANYSMPHSIWMLYHQKNILLVLLIQEFPTLTSCWIYSSTRATSSLLEAIPLIARTARQLSGVRWATRCSPLARATDSNCRKKHWTWSELEIEIKYDDNHFSNSKTVLYMAFSITMFITVKHPPTEVTIVRWFIPFY